jgi:hypothetical protein
MRDIILRGFGIQLRRCRSIEAIRRARSRRAMSRGATINDAGRTFNPQGRLTSKFPESCLSYSQFTDKGAIAFLSFSASVEIGFLDDGGGHGQTSKPPLLTQKADQRAPIQLPKEVGRPFSVLEPSSLRNCSLQSRYSVFEI